MMSNEKQKAIPARLDRYELKYLIPESMIQPISDFASIYCSLDKYSFREPDQFYQINNLYLDTPQFLFLRKRIEQDPNRFNMRVRSYGSEAALPYFVEIKQKIGGVGRKYRAPVDSQAWQEIFYDPEQSCQLESGQDNASRSRKLFYRMMWTYNAEPKVITQYWRKAFVSNVNDYARVTFDIKLRCQAEKGFNLKPDQAQMVSYDHPESFRYTGGNVILELKCYTAAVPLWMIDLIQTFDLSRSSFSKYRFGMTDLSRMWKYHQAARQSIFE